MNEKELLSFILRAKNRRHVLLLLDKGSRAQAEITKMTGMYKSHCSRTIKELCNLDIIEAENPKDRSFVFYKLSKKGENLVVRIKQVLRNI